MPIKPSHGFAAGLDQPSHDCTKRPSITSTTSVLRKSATAWQRITMPAQKRRCPPLDPGDSGEPRWRFGARNPAAQRQDGAAHDCHFRRAVPRSARHGGWRHDYVCRGGTGRRRQRQRYRPWYCLRRSSQRWPVWRSRSLRSSATTTCSLGSRGATSDMHVFIDEFVTKLAEFYRGNFASSPCKSKAKTNPTTTSTSRRCSIWLMCCS